MAKTEKADTREQREIDRDAELARQQAVIDAVARRNAEIAAGANPDPNEAEAE
jgi:hypothetical protein